MIITAQSAYIFPTVEIGIHNAHVLYRAARDISEQADIICIRTIEIQSADGIAVAVECSGVSVVVIVSDRSPATESAYIACKISACVKHACVHGDTCCELCASGSVLRYITCTHACVAVHQPSKPIQLFFTANLIRTCLCSYAICGLCRGNSILCPRRGGHHHCRHEH